MSDKSNAIRALQDVKKMKRAIRLRNSTDPAANAIILDNILKESLMARQILGPSRLGRNAVDEIKNVRNDLIAGNIDVGELSKEYIAKFTTVYNEIRNIDQEERSSNTSRAVREAKDAVRSIIPSRQLVTSALMATNPAVGYGFKIGSSLLSGLGGGANRSSSTSQSRIKSLYDFDGTAMTNQSRSPISTQNNEIGEKLDLIYEELRNIKDPILKIEDGTEKSNRIERMRMQDQALLNRELDFESRNQSSGVVRLDRTNNTTAGLLGGVAASAVEDGGLIDGSMMGNVAAGTVLGRLLAGGAMLAGIKVAAVGAAGYILYNYRNEILDMFREADISSSTPGFGGSNRIRESVESTANSIQAMDDYVNALPEMTSLLEEQTSKQNSLNNAQSEWERLLEISNEEMDNQGFISSETSSRMIELNGSIQDLESELESLTQKIRETRIQGRRDYQSSRQTGSQAIPTGSSEDMSTWQRILQQESGNRQFDDSGNTILGPQTRYGRAVGASQILESTAEEEARRLGIPFDRDRLYNDEDYNKMLGQSYFNRQLAKYGDSVLASMAYNSGPGNVDRLIREFGDPSKGEISHSDFLRRIETTYPSSSPNSWAAQTVPYARNTGMMTLSESTSNAMAQNRTTQPSEGSASVNQNIVNNTNVASPQRPQNNNVGSSQNNEPTWRRLTDNLYMLGGM